MNSQSLLVTLLRRNIQYKIDKAKAKDEQRAHQAPHLELIDITHEKFQTSDIESAISYAITNNIICISKKTLSSKDDAVVENTMAILAGCASKREYKKKILDDIRLMMLLMGIANSQRSSKCRNAAVKLLLQVIYSK